MEKIKNAANAAGEKISVCVLVNSWTCFYSWHAFEFQEVFSGASAEHNKERAKDPSNTAGERVGAGVDYVKDKMDESSHATSKEINKQKATH